MAKRRFTIYCDESSKAGKKFANFYGGALMKTEDRQILTELLNTKKEELGLAKELKWTRVTSQYLERYVEFTQYYMSFVRSGRIKIRVMFTSRRFEAVGLSKEQRDETYFRLYYQFLKHAFGLSYSNPNSIDRVIVELLIDAIPDTKEKADKFKSHLSNIGNTATFRGCHVTFPKHSIAEVDSSQHVILQGLDVILGSMQFRLNERHLEKPNGSRTRGKRTIAKEKLYKEINRQIRMVYPNFNIGITTGTQSDIRNRWEHPYRHWEFTPRNRRMVVAPSPPTE